MTSRVVSAIYNDANFVAAQIPSVGFDMAFTASLLRFAVVAALCISHASSAVARDLLLSPGETLEVLVYGRDDMSGERTIDAEGRVLVPLYGRVDAAGATPAELESRIARGLSEAGLIQAPQVFVEVVRRREVHVAGAVRTPGAHAWSPGATVEQMVARSGGPQTAPIDDFGKLLQSYATVGAFEALVQSIAELEAREARLRAEMAFVEMAFGRPAAGASQGAEATLPPGAEMLDIWAFLPAEDAGASPEAVLRGLSGYDITAFRRLQRDRPDLALIRFPERVAANALLSDVRETQQKLIVDHVAQWLVAWNGLEVKRDALARQADRYQEQQSVLEDNLGLLEAQLENVRSLRERGLARETDLLNLQSAYANLLTSRLALLDAISENETERLEQERLMRSFDSNRSAEIGDELEQVRGALTEARSRKDQARLAANVAAAWRGTGRALDETPRFRYQIRRGGQGDLLPAGPSAEVLPGDVVLVSLIEDF
jgi:hypothetical protein